MTTRGRTPSKSRWTGLAPDDRRSERRAELIEVAFDLLGTEGYGGTTVRAVCAKASFNPRYFYESFADLDALVVAVYDHVIDQLAQEVLEALGRKEEPRQQMRAAIDCIVRFVDDDRRRARVLYVEALGNEALNKRRIETGHFIVGFIEQYSIDQRGGRTSKREHIGTVASAILVGGLSELIVSWLAGRIPVSRDQLVDDATALFIGLSDAALDVAASRGPRRR